MNIAFCGYKGSGKDYAGSIVAENYGHRLIAFADPIKESICRTYKLANNDEYDQFKRTIHTVNGKDIHGRDIVRDHGMFARLANPNFFTTIAQEKSLEGEIVITDLRFVNEYEMCKLANIVTIQVTSDNTSSDGHESESIDFVPDYVIHNDHTYNFKIQLLKLMKEIYKNGSN